MISSKKNTNLFLCGKIFDLRWKIFWFYGIFCNFWWDSVWNLIGENDKFLWKSGLFLKKVESSLIKKIITRLFPPKKGKILWQSNINGWQDTCANNYRIIQPMEFTGFQPKLPSASNAPPNPPANEISFPASIGKSCRGWESDWNKPKSIIAINEIGRASCRERV